MAKTFLDYITECESYGYSQAHYDLMKETSELELMCQYIENQHYMADHPSLFSESVNLSDGFLMESADETTLGAIYERAEVKAQSIKVRILQALAKLWQVFKNLLNKLLNKFDATCRKGQELRAELKKTYPLAPVDVREIQKIIDAAQRNNKNRGFKVRAGQPYVKKTIVKLDTSVVSEDAQNMINGLAAAISDSTVVADVSGMGNVCALPIEKLKAASIAMRHGGKPELDGVKKNIESAMSDARKDGITISVNSKDIERAIKLCNDISADIKSELDKKAVGAAEKIGGAVQKAANAAAGAGVNVNVDAAKVEIGALGAAAKVMNGVHKIMNEALGQTMNVYSGLTIYRQHVIEKTLSYLHTKSPAADENAPALESPKDQNKRHKQEEKDAKKAEKEAKKAKKDDGEAEA